MSKDTAAPKDGAQRSEPIAANETSDDQPASKAEEKTVRRNALGGALRSARAFVEFCGKHPFATGLFAIIGVTGFLLSVYDFQLGREEASSSTEQLGRLESRIEDTSTTGQVDQLASQVRELSEKVGAPYRGGIFLFEEPVEIYWNDWWGFALKTSNHDTGYVELTIRAEGKTVDFVGTLGMNCENGKYRWRGVENFYNPISEESDIAELVPDQVIKNVYKLFCA